MTSNRRSTPRRLWDWLTTPSRATDHDGEEDEKDLPSSSVNHHLVSSRSPPTFTLGSPSSTSGFVPSIPGSPPSTPTTVCNEGFVSPGGDPLLEDNHHDQKYSTPSSSSSQTRSVPAFTSDSVLQSVGDLVPGSTIPRKDLPKIVYSKLTYLSLDNFNEYVESIAKLGYSRCWSSKFYQPTLQELNDHQWPSVVESADEELIRREA